MQTILVVEDEIDVRETYMDLLEASGYAVAGVGTASEALKWLFRYVPTAIILDIHLPGASGQLVLSYVRRLRRFAQTRIVIASGATDLNRESALMWGADEWLTKPVSAAALRASVAERTAAPSDGISPL